VGVSDPTCVVVGAEVSSGWNDVKLTTTTVVGVMTSMSTTTVDDDVRISIVVGEMNCDSSTTTVDDDVRISIVVGEMNCDSSTTTTVVGVMTSMVVGEMNCESSTTTVDDDVRISIVVGEMNCDSSTTGDVPTSLDTTTLKLLVGVSTTNNEELNTDSLCVGEGVSICITELVNSSRDEVGVGSSNTELVDGVCRVGVTSKDGRTTGDVAPINEVVGWSKNEVTRACELVDELGANTAEDDKKGVGVVSRPTLLVSVATGVVLTDSSRDIGAIIDDDVTSWVTMELGTITVLSSGTNCKVVLTTTVSTGEDGSTDEESVRSMVGEAWIVVNAAVGVTTGDETCTATELVASKTSELVN
jgi:hypothetical protein